MMVGAVVIASQGYIGVLDEVLIDFYFSHNVVLRSRVQDASFKVCSFNS